MGYKIDFWVYQHFSMISLASALEVLRAVNQVLGQNYYGSRVVSTSEVLSDTGVILKTCRYSESTPDILFFVASDASQGKIPNIKLPDKLGGIEAGTLLLAQEGLLDHHCAYLHGHVDHLETQFPNIRLTDKPFTIDRNRLTCSGGSASTDMMLALIASEHTTALATEVSASLVRRRLGQAIDTPRSFVTGLHDKQSKLNDVMLLMEANIEEPLGADELASLVNISRRHLERIFKKHLGTVPSKYYLRLRLKKARTLLQQSGLSVVDVAVACGFSNASHFSTAYKNCFGVSPRHERLNFERRA